MTFLLEKPQLREALPVLPIALLNGCSLVCSNSALLYGGVAFVSMITSTGPLLTFLLEFCKGKKHGRIKGGFFLKLTIF